jgi:hypothetical protein
METDGDGELFQALLNGLLSNVNLFLDIWTQEVLKVMCMGRLVGHHLLASRQVLFAKAGIQSHGSSISAHWF